MGSLFLVSTPIGNLSDLSERAKTTLEKVDLILCEDTRKTGLLLNKLGLNKELISFHEHNEDSKLALVLSLLSEGKVIALVSDAGTPTISDPGFKLVREALKAGFNVESIPGPAAFLTALTISGLPTDRFLFLGYLPKTEGKALVLLEKTKKAVENLAATIILYESPHRLLKTLKKLVEIFPGANISVSRELTKVFEETERGSIGEVFGKLNKRKTKGEYTLVLRDQVPSRH